MANIFESLLDGVSDLGDWIEGGVTSVVEDFGWKDVAGLGKNAFNGVFKVQESQKAANANTMRASGLNSASGTVGTQGNAVDPRKADYGLANFAPDASAIEAHWHGLLTKLVGPKETMVDSYKFKTKR